MNYEKYHSTNRSKGLRTFCYLIYYVQVIFNVMKCFMTRGNFDFINSNVVFSEADKSLWIDLINTDCIWYDMIINPPDDIRTNKIIKNYLRIMEKYTRESCEKRFIYFLGSRKKVRFSTKKQPRYNPFTKNIVFTLLIGKEERKLRIKYSFCTFTQNGVVKVTPNVRVTEKFLYIEYENGNLCVMSVHDFVNGHYIDLGIHTEVHYVGYTRHPHRRPVDFIHRGLSKMLYGVSNDDNDFFVCFSIFNPRIISLNNKCNVVFNISNSLLDEIDVDNEGRIIENCLIRYFDPKLQDDDKESKRSDLNKMFMDLVENKKIKKIYVNFQYERNNEYFCFYSKVVPPKFHHFFVLDFSDGKINIDRDQDMMTQMALCMGYYNY
ncbi:hypothetical protein V9O26_001879 [Escherichia coli]|uniref:Uncharacterized protein n=2 Tax=Escherichia coli TaxID=562 RepID=A0A8T6QGQ4_ECOLX|nr:hypothetical protein [Escherichia coli]EES4393003.1 hypothetical protein [Escherichia coli]EFJ9805954.1 hypothetical protein [Escherichia coli]EFK0622299.1 hypothetical protein [Escherichia coli]EFK2015090.1 hypothetical protein [Escherichia coli]EIY3011393.1 hypothetical protein [Escherichia coli]